MDNAHVLKLAQRTAAGLDSSADANFRATLYRDRPDFQALDALSKNYVQGAPPPTHPAGSWLSFVFSKPSIGREQLEIHLLEPSIETDAHADELWLKLKRPEALESLFPSARPARDAASLVNRAIVAWAARAIAVSPEHIRYEEDLVVAGGPEWLHTPLEVRRETDAYVVRSPVTFSPLDASPRFAGMHYMKVVSPSWARARLTEWKGK
jgi:hypothetical protein